MDQIGIAEKKNTVTINYAGTELTLSGGFDSGNLNWAELDPESQEIQVRFGKDKEVKPSAKCWFYFSISGTYQNLPLRLHLLKTNSLNMVAKSQDVYRPVVRTEGSSWQRHTSPVQFEVNAENDVSFHMELELKDSKTVYIANCYPWSLGDNQRFIEQCEQKAAQRKDIYFTREVLIESVQKRPIHLIALSSADVSGNQSEEFLQHLFPNRDSEQHFKAIKKPLVLLTARIHPGQVGSSYTLKGMMDFLLGGTLKANQILQSFYFLIVPILNPDGVYNGNNRMDALGQNLNRFYLFPELEKQPACFAIKQLLGLVRHQLFAFLDLHGHSNKKGFYLYGNSISDQNIQAESVLFAQHLASICEYIDFKSCNFSKKQMSSKDKNDDFSKEGCARVVVYKWTNSPYCYTLQTSLYKNVKIGEDGQEIVSEEFYGPQTYSEVGSKMLLSLHAIFSNQEQLEDMRKEALDYVIKMEKEALQKEKEKQKKKTKKKGTKKEKKKEQIDDIKEEDEQEDKKDQKEDDNNLNKEEIISERKSAQKIEEESIDYLLSLNDQN